VIISTPDHPLSGLPNRAVVPLTERLTLARERPALPMTVHVIEESPSSGVATAGGDGRRPSSYAGSWLRRLAVIADPARGLDTRHGPAEFPSSGNQASRHVSGGQNQ
jgi:hypothetical protein